MKKLLFGLLPVLALVSSANAAIILTLDAGGGNSVTITDGGVGDSNASAGVVTWIGSLGVWNVNVSTGFSSSGQPGGAVLDLNSIDRSTGAGTLVITLTDTGFTGGSSAVLNASIGGTTDGSILAQSWINPSNVSGAKTGPAANPGNLVGSPFSGKAVSGAAALSGPFSITETVTITHAGAGLTSFDFAASTVPEPTTLWSAAMGLGLCAVYARRRKA